MDRHRRNPKSILNSTQPISSLSPIYPYYLTKLSRLFRPDYLQRTALQRTRHKDMKQNLYQYLHFSSNHPKTHKSVITGECIRYITTKENYDSIIHLFKQRGYPDIFVNKTICTVSYGDRQRHLQTSKPRTLFIQRPIFKCLPPPCFSHLKKASSPKLHYATSTHSIVRYPRPQNA